MNALPWLVHNVVHAQRVAYSKSTYVRVLLIVNVPAHALAIPKYAKGAYARNQH